MASISSEIWSIADPSMTGQARHWQDHPLPALVPVSARSLADQDIHSIRRLLATLGAEALELPADLAEHPHPFTNINTADAFARLGDTGDTVFE